MRKYELLLIMLACGSALGCSDESKPPAEPAYRTFPLIKAKDNAVLSTVDKAESWKLHEGLPHHNEEAELLATELTSKSTIKLHGFPFYSETLDLKEADEELIRDALRTDGLFCEFRGYKLCGGFHPDYAVEWTVDRESYYALLCFSCKEAKLYGPSGEHYVDFNYDAEQWKSITPMLRAYQKNRPKFDPNLPASSTPAADTAADPAR